jgi:hypothetical protein
VTETPKIPPQNVQLSSELQQQISMLNIRINDMMTQLNAVMKIMLDENITLKKKNLKLKAKQKKPSNA